jgi:hypothetical protein
MDCVFNTIPPPHGAHVHTDALALYPAGAKETPAFWADLRGGEVELAELAEFVRDAAGNEATRRHVSARVEAAGLRALHEGLEAGLPSLRESLLLDESRLQPLDLHALRRALERDEL